MKDRARRLVAVEVARFSAMLLCVQIAMTAVEQTGETHFVKAYAQRAKQTALTVGDDPHGFLQAID